MCKDHKHGQFNRRQALTGGLALTAGVAALAGVQVGVFDGIEDIAGGWEADKSYSPKMEPQQRERLYDGWKRAVNMLIQGTKGK